MILLATFVTINFGEWRQSWHGTSGLALVGQSAFHPVSWANQGILAALDPHTGECLWTHVMDTPSGFALGLDQIYVNSMYGNRVSVLSSSVEEIDVLSRWYMSDLHSLAISGDRMLVSSSGVDGIVEMDSHGKELWAWFASDHAYPVSEQGIRRRVRRGQDYRRSIISTHEQTTHCNSAVPFMRGDREVVLATLFHQGQLIEIDRRTGRHRVLVTGMDQPHSLRRAEWGWLLCDSRSNAVVMLDEDFWIIDVLTGDFDWVQDAVVHDGRILVADANHSRLVWLDVEDRRQAGEIVYSDQWKIYQVEPVEGEWETRLTNAGLSLAKEGSRLLHDAGVRSQDNREDLSRVTGK